ncbi:ornithine cyclodeaminase family protein [Leifsonia sp. 2MCAF36]|uniref:ornithine cyclodeaminase family protein n=1 Tax=Leifsonia sp. 2MCAF36 TaxID=3232988 RepID=UPI003F9EB939
MMNEKARHTITAVGPEQIRAAVGLPDLIEPVAEAFRRASAGEAESGLVVMFPALQPDEGDVYVKTGTLTGSPVHIVKVSPWFRVNVEDRRPQGGFIAVLDSRTGHTLALLQDDHYLSDLRTAAAGAVVARSMVSPGIRTALVVGSGTQAYWQSLALHRERPYQALLVWARDPQKAHELTMQLAPVLHGVTFEVVSELEPSVRRADVILTTTQAREPLIQGRWLRPGQHITAIGADDATKCELDTAVLRRARVFVDARDTARETGEVFRAIRDDGYALDEIAGELGEILAGATPARTRTDDITVATLSGLGVQDLVAAQVALQRLGLAPKGFALETERTAP